MPGLTVEVHNVDIRELRGDMHRMEANMHCLEVAMMAGFQRLERVLTGEIRKVESTFTDELHKTEKRLDDTIHRVEVQVTEKLGQVQTQLTEKIGEVETQLGNRISQVEMSLAKTETKLLERSIELNKLVAGVQGGFRIVKLVLSDTLATAVGGVISFTFWAGIPSARIGSMEDRANKVDTRLERVEGNTPRPNTPAHSPVPPAAAPR